MDDFETGSTTTLPPSSSSTTLPRKQTTPAPVPAVPTKAKLIPTNSVTLRDGTTVRVRIEATLTVEDVVRQLCLSVKVKDPPGMFALRDESDELVTNENLRKKIKAKVNLK